MDYMYFTFDGVSSERYNLLVQNQGEDLIFPSQPGFENQIISPIYQGANYLAGVNKKERIFSFNCWVDSISTEVVREMLNWISVDKIGTLTLDYNPNFSYKVKINSISDFKHLPVNEDGTYNYEFQLSFITIGSPSAQSKTKYYLDKNVLSYGVIGPNFDNGCPIAFKDNNIFKFLNYYSDEIPLLINIKTTEGFQVKLNNTTYYEYEIKKILTKTTSSTIVGSTVTLYFSQPETIPPFNIGNKIAIRQVLASGANQVNCYQIPEATVLACTTEYVQYNILYEPTGNFTITTNGFIILSPNTFAIDTEYGFCRLGGELAESITTVNNVINIGSMKIPSAESQVFISRLLYIDQYNGIIEIDNSNKIISYDPEEYIARNLYVIVQDGSYGDDSTPGTPDDNSLIVWTPEEIA